MFGLSTITLIYFAVAAFIVGFTKTSVGGMGILAVLLMALAFPGKASPGILLPMLVIADIFAVLYYRRSCRWSVIIKIFPLTAIGVFIGYFLVDIIAQDIFEKSLGILILAMLVLSFVLEKYGNKLSNSKIFIGITGIAAGIATMMGNAAARYLVFIYYKWDCQKNNLLAHEAGFSY